LSRRERDVDEQDDSHGLPFFIITNFTKKVGNKRRIVSNPLSVDLLPQVNTCLGLGVSKECNQMILPQYATSPPLSLAEGRRMYICYNNTILCGSDDDI
jgi:hypothetical protein